MTNKDDSAAQKARAERIRQQVKELTGEKAAQADEPPAETTNPRAFTDQRAREAAKRERDQRQN